MGQIAGVRFQIERDWGVGVAKCIKESDSS